MPVSTCVLSVLCVLHGIKSKHVLCFRSSTVAGAWADQLCSQEHKSMQDSRLQVYQ
jgi:hypothetical protein